MRNLITTFATVGLVAFGAVEARAGTDILYFTDGNNGTDEMAAALAALPASYTITTVSDLATFTTDIGSGTYQLGIFAQQESAGPNYDTARNALASFVAGGGRAIIDDWAPFTDLTAFGATFTGAVNGPAANLTGFNGGVTNPVTLTNPAKPYANFSTGLNPVPGAAVDATFFDPGNASGTDGESAIVVGNSGRSIINGFMNDVAGAPGEQIYTNEIIALTSPGTVPEPSTWAMMLLGFTGLSFVGYRKAKAASVAA
jgi:hypothetical protein